jgi:hypothetical protein
MFTLAFWRTTAEAVVTTFITSFAGFFLAQGGYTVKGLVASASAAGMAALAVFVKQLGAVQSAKAALKVSVSVPATTASGK